MEVAIPRVLGAFFKAMVQAVLLFGLDMWVINPCIGRSLGGVQHIVTSRIMGIHPK